MKKLFILIFGSLFASSAMSANWVTLGIDGTGSNQFSVDTTSVKKVPTMRSTTGEVKSAWTKVDVLKGVNKGKYVLFETYFKCKERKTAINTILAYNQNGSVTESIYNVSGKSVDFASFESYPPDSASESVSKIICNL